METNKDEWASAEALSNLPLVNEVLQGFAGDPTGDNGVMVVREVMRALAKQADAAPVSLSPKQIGDMWNEAKNTASAELLAPMIFARAIESTLAQRVVSETVPYGYRGHHAWRELEEAFNAGRAKLSAGVAIPEGWQKLERAGQIKKGDKLRFTCAGRKFTETARLILNAGTDKEEIVYNMRQNFYFITSMAIAGTSSHKDVEVLAAAPSPESRKKCWCHTCRPVTQLGNTADNRMVLCPTCGNKRCPHANDHRNSCTNSNEPGQAGSAYPAARQPADQQGVIEP